MVSDKALAGLIEEALRRDERVYLQPIDVFVKDGVVTLAGTVRSHRRKLVAYEIASSFEGCRDVVNRLKVDSEAPLPDKEVAKNVLNSLNASADIEEDSISVSATDGVVDLNGAVKSPWERTVAEYVARQSRGVRDVHNCIVVDIMAAIDQEELAKEIKTAFEHARDLKGTDIDVQIKGRSVVLLGRVSLLMQKETAETVVRRFGLQDIRNEIIVRP